MFYWAKCLTKPTVAKVSSEPPLRPGSNQRWRATAWVVPILPPLSRLPSLLLLLTSRSSAIQERPPSFPPPPRLPSPLLCCFSVPACWVSGQCSGGESGGVRISKAAGGGGPANIPSHI